MPLHPRLRLARLLAFSALAAGWVLQAAAFDLQAHRGGRGLAPENTLAAFDHALTVGVTTLELDIAITADGVAVVSHDPYLSPALARDATGQWVTGNGTLIHGLTLAQVQAYDVGRLNPASSYARAFASQQPRDGERIPTLAALFARVKERGADTVRFNIEFKTFPQRPADTASPDVFVDTVLQVIRAAGMESRVTLQSFDWRTLRLAQKVAPAIPTSYLTPQNLAEGAPQAIKAAGGAVWSPNHMSLTAALVKQAQSLGLRVLPWTVNEPADMRRLMGWGVDGLISDYPDRLRAVLQEGGAVLPVPLPAR